MDARSWRIARPVWRAWLLLGLGVALLGACGPTIYPAGPPVQAPSLEQGALITRDGARLPMRSWPAAAPAKGAVIALHGFTDYSAAFEDLGPWLASRGYDVFAFDQRGFGEAPHRGYWAGAGTMVADLVDAMAAVRAGLPDPGLPITLLGESMGGSVAMVAAATAENPPAGLIVAAPGVRDRLPGRPFWDVVFGFLGQAAPGLTIDVERDGPSPLTPRSADRLRNDPLVLHEIRLDSYDGLITLADHASLAAAEIRVPTLVLYGEQDGLIPRVSLCAAVAALPAAKHLVIYPAAPHLVLHWQRHEQVWQDMLQWLENPPDNGAAARAP